MGHLGGVRLRRGPAHAVALAVVAPLLWVSVAYPLEDGMFVIERSAALLLHHGTPYLAGGQITSWLSYNPYLPVMTLFGLPAAAGLRGLAGNAGVWLAAVTVVPLAASFWIAVPHHRCPQCRRDALLATAIAVASPVIGLNLAVITTDPPVLALMLLSLALAMIPPGMTASAGRTIGSGAALAVACDLKSTAWLAVPVMAVMFAARDGARTMWRFLAALVVTALALIALLAPAALVKPGAAAALVQNSVLFPLGLTHDKTPAESLLPGTCSPPWARPGTWRRSACCWRPCWPWGSRWSSGRRGTSPRPPGGWRRAWRVRASQPIRPSG